MPALSAAMALSAASLRAGLCRDYFSSRSLLRGRGVSRFAELVQDFCTEREFWGDCPVEPGSRSLLDFPPTLLLKEIENG